ncbi:MAG: GNAT family N-acetyltransferase [Devosia sp.]
MTKARWRDFDALFSAPGGPSYCWCMAWRAQGEEKKAPGPKRKPMMLARVNKGIPVGLVGYLDGEPAAWVSIAPRDSYRGDLGGPAAEAGENIWSLACMYVPRRRRGSGFGAQLIGGAIAYAKKRGATVLEAYPVDPDSPSYRFMGFVPAYERLGFKTVGQAGSRRHVMRLAL